MKRKQTVAEKIANDPEVHIKIQLNRYKQGLINENEFIRFMKEDLVWKEKQTYRPPRKDPCGELGDNEP